MGSTSDGEGISPVQQVRGRAPLVKASESDANDEPDPVQSPVEDRQPEEPAKPAPIVPEREARVAAERPLMVQGQGGRAGQVAGVNQQPAPATPGASGAAKAVAAPRPLAVDGGGFNRKAAEARERAARQEKMRVLERQIRELAKERAAAQQEARQAAALNAQAVASGIPFALSSPEVYLQDAEKLLAEIRKLRGMVDELKRQDSRQGTAKP
jgi:hypothetical protein